MTSADLPYNASDVPDDHRLADGEHSADDARLADGEHSADDARGADYARGPDDARGPDEGRGADEGVELETIVEEVLSDIRHGQVDEDVTTVLEDRLDEAGIQVRPEEIDTLAEEIENDASR